MQIGAFEITEPLPQLNEPHVFAMLRPWVDAGSVGSISLSRLERYYQAKPLGKLSRPGQFFDFTRYRPVATTVEGRREIKVPNTYIRYAKQEQGHDFLFLHMLEPHMFAEDYLDSVINVLRTFNAKHLVRIGSMYDAVPHTRPLLASGISAKGTQMQGTQPSNYQGPTSIIFQLTERAPDLNMEMVSLMVRLPQYLELEEDFTGVAKALEILQPLYSLPDYIIDEQRGIAQYTDVSSKLSDDENLRSLISRLEALYDERKSREPTPEQTHIAPLAPEVQKFLQEIDDSFENN